MGDVWIARRALRRLFWPLLAALLLAPVPAALGQGWNTEVAGPDKAAPAAPGSPIRRPTASVPGESPSAKAAARSNRTRATAAHLDGDGERTRFRLEVSSPVTANIYAVSEPYRVIADLPDVDFLLPAGTGRRPHGLVTAFRYGLFEAGRARIVIDTAAPIAIEGAQFVSDAAGGGHLVFDLVRVSADRFAALELQARKDALRQSSYDDAGAAPSLSGAKPRPVIVIDPGHGGPDPGTVAGPRLTEKDVVLAVGRQLRALLAAGRRYDVHMTRDHDVFVSLDGRLRHSRRVGADLFISLHIDALAEPGLAHSVRGASFYILSEKASDEAARQLADKENASDLLAGMDSVPSSQEDHVRSILIDLMRRETANFSADFRGLLAGKLKSRMALAREPQRAAAFKVLKQAETPAVLIELGYMSHAEDRALIAKPEWQRQVSASIAEAVDAYFATRQANARP